MIEIVVRIFVLAFEKKLKWPSLLMKGSGRGFYLDFLIL
jgi:hypothetical protein